ncbi:MAG: hypothetical protein M1833_003587 [Piccolia ochrophora]|nr:MAG: hypothetical protein M1833_003587 [Piccolia ochrophora]
MKCLGLHGGAVLFSFAVSVHSLLIPRQEAPWNVAGVPEGLDSPGSIADVDPADKNKDMAGLGAGFPSLPSALLETTATTPSPAPGTPGGVDAGSQAADETQPSPSPSVALLRPGEDEPSTEAPIDPPNGTCPLRPFFLPDPTKWENAKTDEWFDRWWTKNEGTFSNYSGGFIEAFGGQFLENPDFCRDASMTQPCPVLECTQMVFQGDSKTLEPSFYIAKSIENLHAMFMGLSETLQSSTIITSLSKDGWAQIFYRDKDSEDITFWKELANVAATIAATAAAIASIWVSAATGGAAAAAAVVFTGLIFSKIYSMRAHADDTPIQAASIGFQLANFFSSTLTEFFKANDQLLAGQAYGDMGDLRQVFSDGKFVNLKGINATVMFPAWNNLLMAGAINQLWRQQKIFIMGGGPCDDSGGIGSGQQNSKLCRDGKAWYLNYWRERDGPQLGFPFGKTQWGQVDMPPGWDYLGKQDESGDYTAITVQTVINSSLNTWVAGGYTYTPETAQQRTLEHLEAGNTDPVTVGLDWEWRFTIPVCDVSINSIRDTPKKDVILQPWGDKKVPQWCGPVCGTIEQTRDFIHAANMDNFESPYVYCPNRLF